MATGQQRRTVCQACGARCRSTPLEFQIRGGGGWRGHWMWSKLDLCPPCKVATCDAVITGHQLCLLTAASSRS